MGLAQDIVVVNQFTFKGRSGRGSRGSTPGRYVLRYMAREDAVETLAPVRRRDGERMGALLRDLVSDTEADATVDTRERRMRRTAGDPLGGVAFSADDVSLSSEGVRRLSRRIQDAYDAGGTVMKTVVSFDAGYLAREGVSDAGFVPEAKGDWAGHVDQLKLRRAIQNGMRHACEGLDRPVWVGVIQVDTMHVHCHLAIADEGRGRVRANGRQSGNFTDTMKRALRHGIDLELDRMQSLRQLSAAAGGDRQRARALVSRMAYEAVLANGGLQLVLAALPDDPSRWRAGSAARDMRRANAACRSWVEDTLRSDTDLSRDVERHLRDYARTRERREGVPASESYARGHERLIESCMNAVYAVLKNVPRRDRDVSTPALAAAAAEEPAVHGTDVLADATARLVTFCGRMRVHEATRARMQALADDWDRARDADEAVEASRPMRELWGYEARREGLLVGKYRHLVGLAGAMGAGDEVTPVREAFVDARRAAELADDADVRGAGDDAEDVGVRRHGRRGGHVARRAPEVARRVADEALEHARQMLAEANVRLAIWGLRLEETPDGIDVDYVAGDDDDDFEMARSLDLADMGSDFPGGTDIDDLALTALAEDARRRREAVDAAEAWLSATGQVSDDVRRVSEDLAREEAALARATASGRVGPGPAVAPSRPVRTIPVDMERITRQARDDVRRTARESGIANPE